jgi:hypothetical protein
MERKFGFVLKFVGSGGIVLVRPMERDGDGGIVGRSERMMRAGFEGSGK